MYRTILVLLLFSFGAACLPQPAAELECGEGTDDCPTFSKDATKIACECTCEIATSLTSSRSFSGIIDTCLPPSLNRTTASIDQRVAIDTMTDATYSKHVYDVCRDSVAHFIQTITRSQLGSESSPLCMTRPVDCHCAPRDATTDTLCTRPCPDIECTRSSCEPLLRERGTLYVDACICTRARACGTAVPADGEPALCRVSP